MQENQTAKHWDHVWVNTRHAGGDAIAVQDGKIAWLGAAKDLPAHAAPVKDAKGALLTPGVIDCHTHLVYAGNRAHEFKLRLEGASYADIAKAGGGIRSTVAATRAASEEELFAVSAKRLKRLMTDGVTTIEIKSGYGLDLENEMKMLRVARQLGEVFPVRVRTSFLGAHALPPEFEGRQDDYVSHIVNDMLPAIAEAKLADAVDGFCEHIGFTHAQMRRIFEAAKKYNLPVKLHAEQLSNQKGAELVAEFGGLSADHVEYVDEAAVKAMAAADVVAVLLPAAFYCLKETTKPPIDLFRKHGVKMALATDSNPGTAPVESLLLAMNMGCTLFGLTIDEALAGVTTHAAQALGLPNTGSLAVGQVADFAFWDASEPAELVYRIGAAPCIGRVLSGKPV